MVSSAQRVRERPHRVHNFLESMCSPTLFWGGSSTLELLESIDWRWYWLRSGITEELDTIQYCRDILTHWKYRGTMIPQYLINHEEHLQYIVISRERKLPQMMLYQIWCINDGVLHWRYVSLVGGVFKCHMKELETLRTLHGYLLKTVCLVWRNHQSVPKKVSRFRVLKKNFKKKEQPIPCSYVLFWKKEMPTSACFDWQPNIWAYNRTVWGRVAQATTP